MPTHSVPIDADIVEFSNNNPPPPYSAPANGHTYDLTPTPQSHNRPRLPEEKRNPYLTNLPEDVTIVKFQTIVREGKEIVVGRIKVPTTANNSHAFILRRYDTNAVSLTTMYKVAFPGASDEDERREMEWINSTFDTSNTNGGRGCDAVRLAGQWVSRHLAIHLAPAYGISDLVAALARATPDPNVAYRKSQRSQAAAEELARHKAESTTTNAAPVPSLTAEAPSPATKRSRRQSSREAPKPNREGDDGQRHLTLEATTTITAPSDVTPDAAAEIESAKQLVVDLKRAVRLRAAAGDDLEDQGHDVPQGSRGVKRAKGEDDSVVISGGVGKDRIIRSNKRIQKNTVGETTKRAAWGALIFGLGVGAATLLPQLTANFL